MSITFTFEKQESTASPLYKAEAVDADGKVLMTWTIACDDESQLQSLAEETYQIATNPYKPA